MTSNELCDILISNKEDLFNYLYKQCNDIDIQSSNIIIKNTRMDYLFIESSICTFELDVKFGRFFSSDRIRKSFNFDYIKFLMYIRKKSIQDILQ